MVQLEHKLNKLSKGRDFSLTHLVVCASEQQLHLQLQRSLSQPVMSNHATHTHTHKHTDTNIHTCAMLCNSSAASASASDKALKRAFYPPLHAHLNGCSHLHTRITIVFSKRLELNCLSHLHGIRK